MNPLALMQFKNRLEKFYSQHPRVVAFFKENHKELREGAVLEIKITTPEGRSIVTNMRLSRDDVESIEMLKQVL